MSCLIKALDDPPYLSELQPAIPLTDPPCPDPSSVLDVTFELTVQVIKCAYLPHANGKTKNSKVDTITMCHARLSAAILCNVLVAYSVFFCTGDQVH